jgi:hypothetical protein
LDGCIVNGINGHHRSAVAPSCAVGDEVVAADHPADLGHIDGQVRILRAEHEHEPA